MSSPAARPGTARSNSVSPPAARPGTARSNSVSPPAARPGTARSNSMSAGRPAPVFPDRPTTAKRSNNSLPQRPPAAQSSPPQSLATLADLPRLSHPNAPQAINRVASSSKFSVPDLVTSSEDSSYENENPKPAVLPPKAPEAPRISPEIARAELAQLKPRLGLATEENKSSAVGLKLVGVVRGGAADSAGLRIGDFLVSINGAPMSSAMSLMKEQQKCQPGDVMEFKIHRDSAPMTLNVTMGAANVPLPRVIALRAAAATSS